MSVSALGLSLNPQTEATRATRWSYFWKTTAIISAVALTALAAFAVGWTTLFLEADLFNVSIITFFSIIIAGQIVNFLWARGAARDKQARIAGKVAQHWNQLTDTKDTKLTAFHQDYKVAIEYSNDIYKRVYAAFLYQGQRVRRNQDKIAKLKNRLNATSSETTNLLVNGKTEKINPSQYTIAKSDVNSSVFKEITEERSKLLKYEKKLVISKLTQAQLLHFMQNPKSKKCLSDIATFHFPDYSTKQLAKEFGDSSADTVVVTKDYTYNYMQILNSDIQVLTDQFFNDKGTE